MTRFKDIERVAEEYLAGNEALRETLHIPLDAQLVPHHLGMGEHNLNYWFVDPSSHKKYVLRINVTRQPFHENQVRYEFEALRALVPSGCTPAPLFLDDGADAPHEGAMVIGFCPGAQLDFDRLHAHDLHRAACLMANVHAVRPPDDGSLFRPQEPARKLFEECVARYRMYEASGFADPQVVRRMDEFARVTQAAVEGARYDPTQARIVNTETLASHFLLPERSDGHVGEEGEADPEALFDRHIPADIRREPGYFVDWERPILGDIAEDVAFFVTPTTTFWDSDVLFPRAGVYDFVELYWAAVDGRFPRGNFDERFEVYLKVATFRAFTWCCRAVVQQRNGSGAHITKKALAKVPVYLSVDFMDRMAEECFGL